jgi:hypothetical protein
VVRRRAVGVALAGATLLAAAPVSAAQIPSQQGSADPRPVNCAASSEEAPVSVEVTTLAPRAPTDPDEPFQVAGRLTNCGQRPLDRLQVRLAVGNKINSRSGLARAAEEPVLGGRRLPAVPAPSDGLAPGQSTAFDLRLLVGDLALGRQNGVFPLAVQALARYGEAPRREAVGLASTFVPWFPDGPIAPTRIAWLLPLIDQPRRGPDGVLLDDGLASLLNSESGSAGRLARALATARAGASGGCDPPAVPAVVAPAEPAAPAEPDPPPSDSPTPPPPRPEPPCRGDPVPMTYGVDPDLLDTIEVMSRPYTLLSRGDRVTRPASADAQQWLATLRTLADRADVLALPYADPDVVALSRPESGVRGDVDLLRKLGQSEARRLLGVDAVLRSIAWPPPGPLGGALDALVSGGDDGSEPPAVVLDEGNLPEPPALLGRTPSARTTLSSTTGPVTALVIDSALSALVEPDPSAPGWQGARLAEQRWIAEAAVLAAERPSQSRTFVVAPRRRADLLPAVAGAAIADTGRLPWLCPVSLADAVDGVERCATLPDTQGPAPAEDRGTPDRRDRRSVELSATFVERLAQVRALSDQFTDEVLLAEGEQAKATKARLLRARGRAASSAWRQEPAQGRRLLSLLSDDVEGLRAQVRLLSTPVLLTGNTGTIRLTVENRLDQPVNVGIRLGATSQARLSSEETGVREVPASQAVPIAVRVEARTSGRFVARAQLLDDSGDPFGEPVELAVRSTQYGQVALGITGVAAAVLLIAAGARIVRRAVRSGGG